MRLQKLVLEGERKSEKEGKRLPVSSKEDYLRRKWIESRPPLHSRSFYLCRMIEEALRGTDLDGSGKITICASAPEAEKYVRFESAHVSLYYLEREEIAAIEEADEDAGPAVMWKILRSALLDIARRNHRSTEAAEKIETAFAHILSGGFVREERIGKLTKGNAGLTAQVYRVLSAETGEGWYLTIADRKGRVLCRETIDGGTRYVDRLGSRLYARSEWRGNTFVIYERFGKEVFSIGVPPQP